MFPPRSLSTVSTPLTILPMSSSSCTRASTCAIFSSSAFLPIIIFSLIVWPPIINGSGPTYAIRPNVRTLPRMQRVSPKMDASSVVLPLPRAPVSPMRSPSRMEREISFKKTTKRSFSPRSSFVAGLCSGESSYSCSFFSGSSSPGSHFSSSIGP